MEEQKFKSYVQKNVSLTRILRICLSRWYWIFASIVISVGMAYLFLWFTPEKYAVHALIKFDEKRTEMSELINIRNLYDRTNKTESEKMVIQSKTVLKNAVISLQYPISFYHREKFRLTELYPMKPLDIITIENLLPANDNLYFEFQRLNRRSYRLTYSLNDITYAKDFQFNQHVYLPGLSFKIKGTKTNQPLTFKFNTTESLAQRLASALKIDELPNSNLLSLHLIEENPKLAADLLNANLNAYLKFDKSRRLVSLSQTKNFIDTLLQEMSSNLKASGQAVAVFQTRHQFLNVPKNWMDRLSEHELEKYSLEFENDRLSTFQTNTKDYKNIQQLPQLPNGHVKENPIVKSINSINELLLKKQDALNFYTGNAPTLGRIAEQINTLMSTLNRNIEEQKRENLLAIQNLTAIITRIKSNFNQAPDAERALSDLQNRFNVHQKVYSYLAEKKLEAQISNAAIVPGAMIIDLAEYPEKPVYPIKKNTYTLFILAGTAVALILIYLFRTLNPYIYHYETVQALSTVPIVGVVPAVKISDLSNLEAIPMLDHPGSMFSESIRVIRSNLNFIATTGGHKSICITSDASGEGKSFISANLAGSISLLGKRVLLIAADLRKPRLQLIFNPGAIKGLSHYLCRQAETKEIITKTPYPYIDFIAAGPIPPNPSELLHTDRMRLLLNEVTDQYDYIIIDTAPIGLVTDGIPLIQLTDITLFIIRSGVSAHEAALSPERLKREFKLQHIAIVLNAFKNDRFYGAYTRKDIARSHYHTGQDCPQQINLTSTVT